uniref:SB domain-containing protein n=1 Tax=Tanacetum cinerariifolium TaxID=118510 RepID=A0A6L2KMX5_TANCI|nr:hypothetical protein [Tanacetum cinerariifolium]
MVAILEKTKHNTDFHQIVDFLEASHIRYALTIRPTVYVSHIRQFWSTTRVETTDGETQILAQVNGRKRTVSESSIRRHLKLNDEEGISTLPDNELFENLSLMGYNILPNQRFSFQKGQFSHQWKYREAFPTDTSLDAGQDKENIVKTSTMPHEALPKVTSLGDGEGTNILASGGLRLIFTTASTDIFLVVATASGSFPTAAIFTNASVATPITRVTRSSRGVVIGSSSLIFVNIPSISKKDKGKEKMTEPEQPSKEKVLEQMSIQLARDLNAKFAQEDQIIREQAERDAEIARIHAKMMIAELDRSNEMITKHLAQIKKCQAQQNNPATKTERRNFYRSILRSNAGWKDKDFKGMTFEQIKEKFIPVWEKMQDFVPMNSKLESEILKRPGIQLDKERSKKLKTTKASEVTDEKAEELWVELKRLYEPDSRYPLWALQRLSVSIADVYIAKKLATVEDFALLHEDKIYLESKTRSVSYNSLILGTQTHIHIIKLGLSNDVYTRNNSIKMYGSCGEFGNAHKVFDEMPNRNFVSWSLIISGVNKSNEYEVGMGLFIDLMRTRCFAVNEFALGIVMKACVGMGAVEFGFKGVLMDEFTFIHALNACSITRDLYYGRQIHGNEMIHGYNMSSDIEALKLFTHLRGSNIKLDECTFFCVVEACFRTEVGSTGGEEWRKWWLRGGAVQEGAIPVDVYLRNVRLLSREQFVHRATSMKVRAAQMQAQVTSMASRAPPYAV